MPPTTADARLARRALERNGERQHWTVGFKVTGADYRGGRRYISDLEIFTLAPTITASPMPEGKAAVPGYPGVPAGIEVKAATGARPARPRCGICGRTARDATRSTVGKGLICATCVDTIPRVLDDLDALDPTPEQIYNDAVDGEQQWHLEGDGTLARGPRDQTWRP